MLNAEKMTRKGNGKREVLYRNISKTFDSRGNAVYHPNFTWVNKIAKDIG